MDAGIFRSVAKERGHVIKPTIVETLNRKGLHVEWSATPEGVDLSMDDPWVIRVTDSADGGYWFVAPKRKDCCLCGVNGSEGKGSGQVGAMLEKDSLEKFMGALREAGSPDVRMLRLIS